MAGKHKQESPSSAEPPSTEEVLYQRRRAQVRRAQKSHRERRKDYVKGIEEELQQLRSGPDSRIAALEKQNVALRSLLASQGIDGISSSSSPPTESQLCDGIGSPGTQDPYATVCLSQKTVSASLRYGQDKDTLESPGSQSDFSNGDFSWPNSGPQHHSAAEMQAGIDFVLGLEHICMDHLFVTALPGHELMASHHLLTGDSTPPLASSGNAVDPISWQVSTTTLERLLYLSDQLDTFGELTPVQAWQRVRRDPRFPNLTRENLISLQRALLQEAKCYYFGAVIDEDVFNVALDVFMPGPELGSGWT